MKFLKWVCLVVVLLAVTALGIFSLAAYRPAATDASAASVLASPPAREVILASLNGLGVSGKLTEREGPWQPSAGTVSARDAAACPGESATWYDGDQRPTVAVFLLVARCASLETARDLQWNRVEAAKGTLGSVSLPPVVPYAFEGQGTPYAQWPPGRLQQVIFRRGVYYVEATAYVASSRGGDATGLVRRVAVAQSQRLAGIPGPGARSFRYLVTSQLVPSAVVFALLVFGGWVFAGYVRRKLQQSRARTSRFVPVPGVAEFDVTAAANRASWTPRWAAILWVASGVTAVFATSRASSATTTIYWAVTLVIMWAAVKVTGRAARPLRPAKRPVPTPAEAVWLILSVVSALAAALSLTVANSLGNKALAISNGRIDPSIVTDEPLWRWTTSLPFHLLIADFFAGAAVLALAAFCCHWRASRTAHAGVPRATSVLGAALVPVPERLRLRTSATGRPTLPGCLSLRHFEDFHVVAARLLDAFGQVAAGGRPPGTAFGPGIVPVNAAPPGAYSPGEPELAGLASQQRLADLLLVFPPVPAHEVRARWDIFRDRNALLLPSFADDVIGKHADRMLAARWSPDHGWQCWHADVKTEWAYALAFRQAVSPPGTLSPSPHPVPPVGYEAGNAVPGFAAAGKSERASHDTIPLETPPPAPPPRQIPQPGGGEPVQPRTFLRALRFLRSRRWRLALGGGALLALLALNILANLATAPAPFNVTAAAAEYLLPAGAVGGGLKPTADSTQPSRYLGMVERNGARCAQHARFWANPGHLLLEIALTVCSGPGILADAQESVDEYAHGKGIVVGTAGIPYAVETDTAVTVHGAHLRRREVTFRAGPVLTAVVLTYPGGTTRLTPVQVRLVEGIARAQLAELPYSAGPGYGAVSTAQMQAAIPRWIITGLLWVVIGFSAWAWWTRRRHLARGEGPAPPSTARVSAIQVTGRAQRAAWLARSRFTFQLAGGLTLLLSLTAPPPTRYWYMVVGALMLGVSPVLRSRGLRRPLSARRRSGVLTGRRTARALLLVAGSAAAAVAAVGFTVCGLFALALQYTWTVLGSGRIDSTLLALGSPYRILTTEPVKVLAVDFFALAIAALILVPVSYTAARRVAALTADEITRGRDPEDSPPGSGAILYLRNFTDDDIRMPTSRLSRNSIVERIAVYRLERFEEVIVRHLGQFGPVIAVSPPEMDKPPIGAARMNMANADWQAGIRQYITSARLIIVGAAPEGRTSGLAWELGEIADSGALSKTLLVLPPLRSQTLKERWAVFRAMAPGFQLPPELAVGADQHLVLVREEQRLANESARWRTWHSRRRTEWAYAVALRDASHALLGYK